MSHDLSWLLAQLLPQDLRANKNALSSTGDERAQPFVVPPTISSDALITGEALLAHSWPITEPPQPPGATRMVSMGVARGCAGGWYSRRARCRMALSRWPSVSVRCVAILVPRSLLLRCSL